MSVPESTLGLRRKQAEKRSGFQVQFSPLGTSRWLCKMMGTSCLPRRAGESLQRVDKCEGEGRKRKASATRTVDDSGEVTIAVYA